MNPHQLEKAGLQKAFHNNAIIGIQSAHKAGVFNGAISVKSKIANIVATPKQFVDDEHFSSLAKALVEAAEYVAPESIEYPTWGNQIDENCHKQMADACRMPVARAAALMPDAHLGYGLPIGGVLALENAVAPYAVGVDIACRMKLSIFDMKPDLLDINSDLFEKALHEGTAFGVGSQQKHKQDHQVMGQDWNITKVTRELKDRAHTQLGSSGSGNHFVEFGVLTIDGANDLNLNSGKYIALLSHSGSRGAGAAVCNSYTAQARQSLKPQHKEFNNIAWLDMNTEAGQEYWLAMNLMGDYAAANHDTIHKIIAKLIGGEILTGVENHHNFCWKEEHNGKELYVHRKGATPAGEGVLGIIPGSMATPAFVVRGKGNIDSLKSASHGAGRLMSRTQARSKYTWKSVQQDLAKKGVKVLSAGADEVPYAYKDIFEVMKEQQDLVDIIARFDPRIVKMSDDGKAED